MSSEILLDIDISALTRESGMGSAGNSLSNILRGKNWLGGTAFAPKNDDNVGLVFATRPDFNLTYDNIGTHRELSPLLTNNVKTLPYAIKQLLDPESTEKRPLSPLVDNDYPFIPILDNTMTECSGWPDYVLEERVTTAGKYGQQLSSPKGAIQKYTKFSLSTTHQNVKGDMVGLLYHVWLQYIYNTTVKGTMQPHYRNIVANLRDYQTRFYRLVFNTTFTHVTQFTMTSAAWPMTYPGGAVFNYSTEKPINQGYDQYTMQWSAVGCWHNDPLVIREFNRTVLQFNSAMYPTVRHHTYTRVDPRFIQYFNYYGYPWIDEDTLEFSLWVPHNLYKETLISFGYMDKDGNWTEQYTHLNKDNPNDPFWSGI